MSLRLTDLLALSVVPRWSIVDHLKPQSVADHTFRTLVTAIELAERLDIRLTVADIMRIIHHDADECRTGDISGPAKRDGSVTVQPASTICPWATAVVDPSIPVKVYALIKLADQIEAYTFISRYGVGPHARRAAIGLDEEIGKRLSAYPEWAAKVRELVRQIQDDEGR